MSHKLNKSGNIGGRKMKTIYRCEKCGKEFTDGNGISGWDDAYKCEQSHLEPDTSMIWQREVANRMSYKTGDKTPNSMIVPFREYNSDINESEWVYKVYKCIGDVDKKELDKMVSERDARLAQEESDHLKWKTEYEEREAKKKAEEEPESEEC